MAARRSPLGVIVKWLVIPILIGVLGYYIVGPRFGGQVAAKMKDAGVPLNVPDEPAKSFPKPKVSVSSRQLGDSKPEATPERRTYGTAERTEEAPAPRRRRRRPRRTTTQTTPTKPAPTRRSESKTTPPRDAPPVVPGEGNDPPPVIDN